MTYTVSPRALRAKLSTVSDLRAAQARMAEMDATADAADIAFQRVNSLVKRTHRSSWRGYNVNKDGYVIKPWDIKIARDGTVDWGGFVFGQAAE